MRAATAHRALPHQRPVSARAPSPCQAHSSARLDRTKGAGGTAQDGAVRSRSERRPSAAEGEPHPSCAPPVAHQTIDAWSRTKQQARFDSSPLLTQSPRVTICWSKPGAAAPPPQTIQRAHRTPPSENRGVKAVLLPGDGVGVGQQGGDVVQEDGLGGDDIIRGGTPSGAEGGRGVGWGAWGVVRIPPICKSIREGSTHQVDLTRFRSLPSFRAESAPSSQVHP